MTGTGTVPLPEAEALGALVEALLKQGYGVHLHPGRAILSRQVDLGPPTVAADATGPTALAALLQAAAAMLDALEARDA